MTVNYIQNRLPAKDLKNKTSYEMWHKKKSSIGHMRTFECLMYIHILSEIKNKMNKMFNANIFMKYQFNHQYRIFNFKKDVVEIFITMEFYKTHFKNFLFNQKSKKKNLNFRKPKTTLMKTLQHHKMILKQTMMFLI